MSEQGFTRGRLLGAALGAGGAAAFLSACGGDDSPVDFDPDAKLGPAIFPPDEDLVEAFGPGDIGIANYALTLEYFEADMYAQLASSGILRGSEQSLIEDFATNEQDHVEVLIGAIKGAGGTPAERITGKFKFKDRDQALDLVLEVEELGAGAYLGQAPRIRSKEVLKLALSIHTVEGAHAASIATLLGRSIVPDGSISAPESAKTVLDSVTPLIES